jgi:predicted nucleic acid-binding Zn ribbon protein
MTTKERQLEKFWAGWDHIEREEYERRVAKRLINVARAIDQTTLTPELRERLRQAISNWKPQRRIDWRRECKRAMERLYEAKLAQIEGRPPPQSVERPEELGRVLRAIPGTSQHDAAKRISVRHSARKCPSCLKSFTPKRSDAKVCSDRCRQRMFQRNRRLTDNVVTARHRTSRANG